MTAVLEGASKECRQSGRKGVRGLLGLAHDGHERPPCGRDRRKQKGRAPARGGIDGDVPAELILDIRWASAAKAVVDGQVGQRARLLVRRRRGVQSRNPGADG